MRRKLSKYEKAYRGSPGHAPSQPVRPAPAAPAKAKREPTDAELEALTAPAPQSRPPTGTAPKK